MLTLKFKINQITSEEMPPCIFVKPGNINNFLIKSSHLLKFLAPPVAERQKKSSEGRYTTERPHIQATAEAMTSIDYSRDSQRWAHSNRHITTLGLIQATATTIC